MIWWTDIYLMVAELYRGLFLYDKLSFKLIHHYANIKSAQRFSKIYVCIQVYFSFLLNKVVVAVSKPKAKRNKSGFIILYASYSPPLKSRAKTKTSI